MPNADLLSMMNDRARKLNVQNPGDGHCGFVHLVMSRGLGSTQRRALTLLAGSESGLTVAELAARVGCTLRRTYALVDALRERGLAVVDADNGTRRVWLPQLHRVWWAGRWRSEADAAWLRHLAERSQRDNRINCPCCGRPLEANA
jgi:4-hydroxy-3-methylbut-2-en-1-yl diphosphate synthase IspG/GcpE